MNNRAPHHTIEQHTPQESSAVAGAQQINRRHGTPGHYNHQVKNVPKRRHLPPAPFSLEKQIIIICKDPNGQVNREWRFERKDIISRSGRIDDLCRRRRSGSATDIIYVYVEHLHNFFAHYERWIRDSKLPDLQVTVADQRDVMMLWIGMYELAREMDDWRLVAAINVKIIDIAKKGTWSFYKRSVNDYLKKAPHSDELRCLLLDLHVARFQVHLFKRYFWMLSPRLSLAIIRRKMLPHPPTMGGIGVSCAYHQHDHLFPLTECSSLMR
ncbi:hypothetical protein E4T39_00581 [Aureobasidium subglaciale]|nr:hypothetical protein E4T39_00581 [Aureobasidium subglaciale]